MERDQIILISSGNPPNPDDQINHKGIMPRYASDLDLASKYLCDQNLNVLGVFVDFSNGGAESIEILKLGLLKRPGVPLFILDDKNKLEDIGLKSEDFQSFGVQSVISENLSFLQMMDLINPEIQNFDKESALRVARLNDDAEGGVSEADDSEFTSISAKNFLSGSDALFDIYIRLKSGKNIKITQAGQKLDAERIMNYLNKGVTKFSRKIFSSATQAITS